MEEDEPAFLEEVDYSAESDDENDPELEPAHVDLSSDPEFNHQDSLTWGLISVSSPYQIWDTTLIKKVLVTDTHVL